MSFADVWISCYSYRKQETENSVWRCWWKQSSSLFGKGFPRYTGTRTFFGRRAGGKKRKNHKRKKSWQGKQNNTLPPSHFTPSPPSHLTPSPLPTLPPPPLPTLSSMSRSTADMWELNFLLTKHKVPGEEKWCKLR